MIRPATVLMDWDPCHISCYILLTIIPGTNHTPIFDLVSHTTPVAENYWNTGVLKPAQTSSHISSQPHNQWCHVGSLESGNTGVFIPQKSANITNQGFFALFSESHLISFITYVRYMRDVGLLCLVIHPLFHPWYRQKHLLPWNLSLILWHFQEFKRGCY